MDALTFFRAATGRGRPGWVVSRPHTLKTKKESVRILAEASRPTNREAADGA